MKLVEDTVGDCWICQMRGRRYRLVDIPCRGDMGLPVCKTCRLKLTEEIR